MRLSFVIPAYNEQDYLGDCIQSILDQTPRQDLGQDIEIIVVNNASTDRTRDVALAFPAVILVDEPRKGLTFARQAGFLRATGDLIANVDADSRLTPGWIDQVLRTFAQEPQLIALSGPVIYYGLSWLRARMVGLFYVWAWTVYATNRYLLRVGSMVQGGNFVLTRAALEQIGGFNLDISFYGEDTDLARRLYKFGEVRFTFALRMFTSPRRLRQEGMLTIGVRYTLNYLWTIFLKRPFSLHYLDHREEPKTANR